MRAADLLFGLTAFLAAALLFAVQPLVGKHLLPWFGGAPAVWSAALAFFQLALLAGYLYTHRVAARGTPSRHLVLVAVALAVLLGQQLLWGTPLLPDATWRPGPDDPLPAARVLAILAVGVGLPFVVLSASGPLVQAWYASAHPDRSPYPLYALSNLGSLAGLLGYPLLVEPHLDLLTQAWAWAGGYLLLGVALAACGARSGQMVRQEQASAPARALLGWAALSAFPVVLLLALTALIGAELAPMPLLWVVPLALYLLTMALPFALPARSRWLGPPVQLTATLVGAASLLLLLAHPQLRDSWPTGLYYDRAPLVLAHLALGGLALGAHGALAWHRPDADRLTAFYLAIAAGGAAGGLFVGLLAPSFFPGREELYLGALGAAGATLAAVCRTARWRGRTAAVLLWLGLAVGCGYFHQARGEGRVLGLRTFFGIVEVYVRQPGHSLLEAHEMRHGAVTHGLQLRAPAQRSVATGYYGTRSGVGLALQLHPARRSGPLRVGAVGLGVGTIATYGRRGDHYAFFEINPAVVTLARDPAWFDYLSGAEARGVDVDVHVGDGRLLLERQPPARYDVLVIDAFGGDAVPTHLLTAEAARSYERQLAPDGILAIHVSGRHVDLRGVVLGMARELGWPAVAVFDGGTQEGPRVNLASVWVLVTRNPAFLRIPPVARWRGRPLPPPIRWTDRFSDLLGVLQW